MCEPDQGLAYAQSDSFFAMLGLGPIGEGYSLIATRQHVPSMMDLSRSKARELQEFTEQVRARLRPEFGECVITEHGRVAACLEAATSAYEPHCLHAHRLLFPGLADIGEAAVAYRFEWRSYSDFSDAHARFDWPRQYLYAEQADGACQVAPASGPVPRRFFRTLVAALKGTPEAVDWRSQPRLELVEAARERLRGRA